LGFYWVLLSVFDEKNEPVGLADGEKCGCENGKPVLVDREVEDIPITPD
jgi:hypothetical protein